MVLNQLFRISPSLELTNKFVKIFGLRDINDKTKFCVLDMDRLNTLGNFKNIQKEIKNCYIPCKRKKYIDNKIDNKGLLTILRQFLKIHDHDMDSHEKFIKGSKYLIYRIITKHEKENIKRLKRAIPNKEITIVFD